MLTFSTVLYLVTSGNVTSLANLLSLTILSEIFLDAKLLTHTTAASPSPSPSSHSSSHSFITSGEGTFGSTLDLNLKGKKVFKNKNRWHG